MVKSKVYSAKVGAGVSFNLTPMIDVTFQLIIFFILASQMASQSLAQLELARPFESQATDLDKKATLPKVIVNVLAKDPDRQSDDPWVAGQAECYKIDTGTIDLDDIAKLTNELKIRLKDSGVAKSEDFYVEIRADKRVDYSYVAPVMQAAAEAGIANVNLSALLEVSE